MQRVTLAIHPHGLAIVPCKMITLAGEVFAMCRPPLPSPSLGEGVHHNPPAARDSWELIDPESGEYIATGPTQAETILTAKRRLAGLNPGSLERARENCQHKQGAWK